MRNSARTAAQIGVIVRRERRARGLTQAQLGELIGRRQATISKLEKGEPATQLSTLFDVLSALNLQIDVVARGGPSAADMESIF